MAWGSMWEGRDFESQKETGARIGWSGEAAARLLASVLWSKGLSVLWLVLCSSCGCLKADRQAGWVSPLLSVHGKCRGLC